MSEPTLLTPEQLETYRDHPCQPAAALLSHIEAQDARIRELEGEEPLTEVDTLHLDKMVLVAERDAALSMKDKLAERAEAIRCKLVEALRERDELARAVMVHLTSRSQSQEELMWCRHCKGYKHNQGCIVPVAEGYLQDKKPDTQGES